MSVVPQGPKSRTVKRDDFHGLDDRNLHFVTFLPSEIDGDGNDVPIAHPIWPCP